MLNGKVTQCLMVKYRKEIRVKLIVRFLVLHQIIKLKYAK